MTNNKQSSWSINDASVLIESGY